MVYCNFKMVIDTKVNLLMDYTMEMEAILAHKMANILGNGSMDSMMEKANLNGKMETIMKVNIKMGPEMVLEK